MRVAIITGGETGEREVSIRSARNVAENINFAEIHTFTFPEDSEAFTSRAKEFDLAIPVIHGLGGEDGTLQARLKILGVPFIFSDVYPHSVAINKRQTKEAVAKLGIQSPEEISEPPFFVKPVTGGSSVASKLCNSIEEYEELKQKNPGIEFVTEKPIKGREFTVGILEYQGRTSALPVIEIIPRGEFFDFENKYDPTKLAQEICPAEIDPALAAALQAQALAAHQHLRCRHISRSDFIVDSEGNIYFLEINTIPGLTATSLIPKMLKESGVTLKEILKEWCLVNPVK